MEFLSAVWSRPHVKTAKIVLCGDPKQLGPVLKSTYGIGLRFGASLMEVLMEKPCFKVNPSTGKFNSSYIVQLTKNYRSHPIILKSPNEMFYDGTLEALASKSKCDVQYSFNNSVCMYHWGIIFSKSYFFQPSNNLCKNDPFFGRKVHYSLWFLYVFFSFSIAATDIFINSSILSNPKIPIIFKNIEGRCERDRESYRNDAEIEAVGSYVWTLMNNTWNGTTLTPKDIGIYFASFHANTSIRYMVILYFFNGHKIIIFIHHRNNYTIQRTKSCIEISFDA